jgi:hypothetical protein
MNIDLLPKNLKEIANLIGFEKTLLIVEKFAGHRLYVARSIENGSALVSLLGKDDALKVVKFCGGSQIEIPNCKRLKNWSRDALIRQDRTQMNVAQVASKYGLSRGRVQKICNTSN